MIPTPLLIRADATTQIGTGHLMRCIALAQAWQKLGGKITFLSHCENDELRQRIIDEGFDFIPIEKPHPDPSDLKIFLSYLTAIRNPKSAIRNWVVLDGYPFTPDYQKAIRKNGYKLLVIDDMVHLDHYHADILLNQNIYASSLHYSCDRNTVKLLGCEYVLLRKEFTVWQKWRRKIPSIARRILVTLGGSDKDNVTAKVIEALTLIKIKSIEIIIIAGQLNPHYRDLADRISSPNISTSVKSSVSNLSAFLANADLVISAGGSTCYELAFMATPFATIVLAENQVEIANQFSNKGISVNMGWYESLSLKAIADCITELIENRKMRYEMSCKGKGIVDGYGVDRVVRAIVNHKSF